MTILNLLAKRYRTDDDSRDAGERQYVCTICGVTFDDPEVVICPECRGLVRRRTA